jgi:hypothetical protein
MIKQILLILILISTLTLIGCVERGHSIVPGQTIHKTLNDDTSYSTNSTKTKNLQRATDKVAAIESETKESSTEDSTQNTIAGILVLIIGIMVFI